MNFLERIQNRISIFKRQKKNINNDINNDINKNRNNYLNKNINNDLNKDMNKDSNIKFVTSPFIKTGNMCPVPF